MKVSFDFGRVEATVWRLARVPNRQHCLVLPRWCLSFCRTCSPSRASSATPVIRRTAQRISAQFKAVEPVSANPQGVR
jgi:hypothetical protein